MEKRIEETVLEILRNSDMQEMTEYKVRKLAADKLSLDLSEPSRKKFVRNVVETFLQQQADEQQQPPQDDAVEGGEVDEDDEEEDDNKGGDGKEYDDAGDLIICRVTELLSEKRRVTLQDFKGKTLVSIREFYKKDGKFLPTSKGISLTTEQWSSFKKNVPAIEQAIKKMEDSLY